MRNDDIAVDSNGNAIAVSPVEGATWDGLPIVRCDLLDEPGCGYLAACEDCGGFGDKACPSSYGRPCITWYGPRMRYASAADAIRALTHGHDKWRRENDRLSAVGRSVGVPQETRP